LYPRQIGQNISEHLKNDTNNANARRAAAEEMPPPPVLFTVEQAHSIMKAMIKVGQRIAEDAEYEAGTGWYADVLGIVHEEKPGLLDAFTQKQIQ